MKRKMMAGLLVGAMALGMLAGCGGSGSSDKAATTAAAATEAAGGATTEASEATEAAKTSTMDEVIVNIWDSKQQEGIQSICDDWTAKSGVKVRVEVVDWDNYWTLLEAGATGGEMPDVFWMHSQFSEKYMDQGILLDLTPYIEADANTDLANYYSDIVALYQYDGKTYALPKDYDTIGLWYNKDIFDEAGIAYPDETWTWDTLHDVAAQLTKEDGSQFGLTGNTDANQEGYYNAIYSYGGYVINDAKDKSGYDDENTLKAMEMYGTLVKDAMPNQSAMAETGNINLFLSNQVAMGMFGSWYVPTFKEKAEEGYNQYAVSYLPFYDANGNGTCDEGERVTMFNGLGWSAPAKVEDPDTVYSLISYLASKEGQTKQAELGVTMSAYEGTSDAWLNCTDLIDLKPYLEEANGKATLVLNPSSRDSSWAEDAKQQLVAAWQDTSKMADVCKQIAADMNAKLAE
ncbi:MAG: ABC transporter substrate-binding protein [Lachnospiraceae bacterium]